MIRLDPGPGRILWVLTPYLEVDLKPMSQSQGACISELLHVETFICFALVNPFFFLFFSKEVKGTYRDSFF